MVKLTNKTRVIIGVILIFLLMMFVSLYTGAGMINKVCENSNGTMAKVDGKLMCVNTVTIEDLGTKQVMFNNTLPWE